MFIGKIDIMKSFSFFEIEKEQKVEIQKKLNNIKWRGTQLKLEIAKEFSKDNFRKEFSKDNFRRKKKRKEFK